MAKIAQPSSSLIFMDTTILQRTSIIVCSGCFAFVHHPKLRTTLGSEKKPMSRLNTYEDCFFQWFIYQLIHNIFDIYLNWCIPFAWIRLLNQHSKPDSRSIWSRQPVRPFDVTATTDVFGALEDLWNRCFISPSIEFTGFSCRIKCTNSSRLRPNCALARMSIKYSPDIESVVFASPVGLCRAKGHPNAFAFGANVSTSILK